MGKNTCVTIIRDLQLRALACNRSKRFRAEANAYFAMGVVYDKVRQHLKAINCYTRFANVLTGNTGSKDTKW